LQQKNPRARRKNLALRQIEELGHPPGQLLFYADWQKVRPDGQQPFQIVARHLWLLVSMRTSIKLTTIKRTNLRLFAQDGLAFADTGLRPLRLQPYHQGKITCAILVAVFEHLAATRTPTWVSRKNEYNKIKWGSTPGTVAAVLGPTPAVAAAAETRRLTFAVEATVSAHLGPAAIFVAQSAIAAH
jgi:hypothetical protein